MNTSERAADTALGKMTLEQKAGQLFTQAFYGSAIMDAIAKKYGIPRACVLAVKAGSNLILMKETGPIRNEAYRQVVEAVRNGEISEDHLDPLVLTTLKTKFDHGLYGPSYWWSSSRRRT